MQYYIKEIFEKLLLLYVFLYFRRFYISAFGSYWISFLPQCTLMPIAPVSSASTAGCPPCWSWSPSCLSRHYGRPSLKLSSSLPRRNTNKFRNTCRYDILSACQLFVIYPSL